MGRRLILDTGILIAIERGDLNVADVLRPDDDVAIAAVTVTELRVGIHLADSTRRAEREASVQRVVDRFPVEPYTLDTTDSHAGLLAHCKKTGTPRGAMDLIIAATAAATSRAILTRDEKAGFDTLPGVDSAIV